MTPVRIAALKNALAFVGVTEDPPGSNRGRIVDQFNESAGVPAGSYWCCSFMHFCFQKAGFLLPGGASVGLLRAAALSNKWVVLRPRRGDLACLGFGESAWKDSDHIGQVVRVLALRWSNGTFTGLIRTVEGNTSAQAASGSQSNGGGVFIRTRWVRGITATFVRVPGTTK